MKVKLRLVFIAVVLTIASSACQNISFLEPTETPTAAVPPTPLPDTYVEENPDGSVRMVDVEYGYAFTLPDNWLVLESSSSLSAQLQDFAVEKYPNVQETLERLATQGNQDFLRFIAMDLNAEANGVDFLPNISIAVFVDDPGSLPVETIVEIAAESIPNMFTDAEIVDQGMFKNEIGDEFGFIVVTLPSVSDATGRVQQKQVYIRLLDVGVLTVTFSTTTALYPEAIAEFDEIVNTFYVEN